MASAVKIEYVQTGIREFDQVISELGKKSLIRQTVNRPAAAALQTTAAQIKVNSRRTHPRSMLRNPVAQGLQRAGVTPKRNVGPMSRYVSVRAISARSQSVGARAFYDTRRFPGFVVMGKSTKKRAFYPAAQEYGAPSARPSIKPKRQMERAAQATRSQVLSVFRAKFKTSYEAMTVKLARRAGLPVQLV